MKARAAGRHLRHAQLVGSNAALQEWAREHAIDFDTSNTPDGTAWRGRVEHYLTDPSEEPDPTKRETDVAYLTTGRG